MPGKMSTLKRIKPIGKIQWKAGKFYVYSELGEVYFEDLSKLNTEILQEYLNNLSQIYSENFNLIIINNGRFHKAIDLTRAR